MVGVGLMRLPLLEAGDGLRAAGRRGLDRRSWPVRAVPEPSRLPCMPDRSTMTPDSVAARTGRRADPGLDRAILAREEALAADAAGRPALGRVIGERGDLDRRAASVPGGRPTGRADAQGPRRRAVGLRGRRGFPARPPATTSPGRPSSSTAAPPRRPAPPRPAN